MNPTSAGLPPPLNETLPHFGTLLRFPPVDWRECFSIEDNRLHDVADFPGLRTHHIGASACGLPTASLDVLAVAEVLINSHGISVLHESLNSADYQADPLGFLPGKLLGDGFSRYSLVCPRSEMVVSRVWVVSTLNHPFAVRALTIRDTLRGSKQWRDFYSRLRMEFRSSCPEADAAKTQFFDYLWAFCNRSDRPRTRGPGPGAGEVVG